jgi:Carbonic anhydrase
VKRRALAVLAVGAAVASLAVTASAAAPTAWNHDPGSAIGPPHWGTLDPAFAQCETGTSQSPVDISGAGQGGGPSLQFRYPDNELVVENTGHVIEVPLPADNGNTLKIGNSVYTLTQYHFHAPSEHTLNGRRYDLEGPSRSPERRRANRGRWRVHEHRRASERARRRRVQECSGHGRRRDRHRHRVERQGAAARFHGEQRQRHVRHHPLLHLLGLAHDTALFGTGALART